MPSAGRVADSPLLPAWRVPAFLRAPQSACDGQQCAGESRREGDEGEHESGLHRANRHCKQQSKAARCEAQAGKEHSHCPSARCSQQLEKWPGCGSKSGGCSRSQSPPMA